MKTAEDDAEYIFENLGESELENIAESGLDWYLENWCNGYCTIDEYKDMLSDKKLEEEEIKRWRQELDLETVSAKKASEILSCTRSNISRLLKKGTLVLTSEGITLESVLAYRDAPRNPGGRPLGSYKD